MKKLKMPGLRDVFYGMSANERNVYLALLLHMAIGDFFDEKTMVSRNQLYVNYENLAKFCELSKDQVRRIIRKFKERHLIAHSRATHGLVVTILNNSEILDNSTKQKRKFATKSATNAEPPLISSYYNSIKSNNTSLANARSVTTSSPKETSTQPLVEQASDNERSLDNFYMGAFDSAWQRYHKLPFSRRYLSAKKKTKELYLEHVAESEAEDFQKGVENYCDNFESSIDEHEFKAKSIMNIIKDRAWADFLVKEAPKKKKSVWDIEMEVSDDFSGHGF